MSPHHIALQTIACYGRVRTGNFPDDSHQTLSDLCENGALDIIEDDSGDTWFKLSNHGKDQLLELNCLFNSNNAAQLN